MSRCCELVHEMCGADAPLRAEVLEGRAVAVAAHREAASSSDVLAEGLLVWSVGVMASAAAIVVAVVNAPGLLP